MAYNSALSAVALNFVSTATALMAKACCSVCSHELLVSGFVRMQDPADSTVYNPTAVAPASSSASNATSTAG